MLAVRFASGERNKKSILCLGAHSDDIEIGCGGAILQLMKTHQECDVTWVVFSAKGPRKREAIASAKRFLDGASKVTIIIKEFKESFFPYQGEVIKRQFELLKERISPDLIFTHYRDDLHQDHRTINELTWNTFRRHFILEYEIPKYDGDLGRPNVFVPIDAVNVEKKCAILLDCFDTQRDKHWFSKDTFISMLRIRGVESNSTTKYAEAFYGRKVVLGK